MSLIVSHDLWISSMAENLVSELTEQMSGIQLSCTETPWNNEAREPVVLVYGLIGGDYTMHVWLLAEESLFCRLARNMMGSDPDAEDIRDYAIEYFNVLCGRFISEIVNKIHISERLFPVKYEIPSEHSIMHGEKPLHTLYFTSDVQEQASFSWTATPTEEMEMRSGK